MLIYLKGKARTRWTQFKSKLQRRDHKNSTFRGSHEEYLRNGAWVLEESIALFHGKANPIFHFSITDINCMNLQKVSHPYWDCWHKGSYGGRPVLVKTEKYYPGEDFLRETVVAAQMASHKNVHKLIGCCLETEYPVLVYEWVEITLQDYIDQNQRVVLEWKDRLRIAWEISHAVAYLHTAFPRPIIHRNVKPRNVFIDPNGAAKLSGFSFCVSIPEGKEFIIQNDIYGTHAYLAPEYFMHRKVAESMDVYSYGRLLFTLLTEKMLSVITEQRQDEHLSLWVLNNIKDICAINGVDPTLFGNGISNIEVLQVRAYIHLALRCVVEEEEYRPSMVEVAITLNNMITHPEPILDSNFFKGMMLIKERNIFRVFCGSEENFVRNETMVVQESNSLFYGEANPMRYFSVDDLNRMNVEFSHSDRHRYFYWYQGSWEGKYVLLKFPHPQMKVSRSSDEILLMFVREIVVATQMATHDNVQKLIGCCLETTTPILVYEWVSSRTLAYLETPLEWKDRLRIAWEISHAVSYLHSAFPRPIVHMFLEPNNIYLNQKKTAKLCNFTRSISIPEGENLVEVSPLTDWNDEYCAPEYCRHGKVGKWTDVYSFGVLFLEFLTGQSISPDYMEEIAKEFVEDECSIIDPTIIENGVSTTELRACLELGLRCIETNEDSRPTMEDTAAELNKIIRSSGSFARV